jgi:hypothetical protein
MAVPAGAASGGGGSPFGARTLGQLAADRDDSVGAFTPKVKAEDGDGDDGNEADEIAEGADQYAEARTSPGVVAPGGVCPSVGCRTASSRPRRFVRNASRLPSPRARTPRKVIRAAVAASQRRSLPVGYHSVWPLALGRPSSAR